MARRNVSIPDDLDDRARAAGLNVSALTRRAILDELDRRQRMSRLDAWLDELDEQHGAPSPTVVAEAEAWARGAVPLADEGPTSAPKPKPRRPWTTGPSARRTAGPRRSTKRAAS